MFHKLPVSTTLILTGWLLIVAKRMIGEGQYKSAFDLNDSNVIGSKLTRVFMVGLF